MVLGVEIRMDDPMHTSKSSIVGWVKGRQPTTNFISKWIKKEWSDGPVS